MQVQNSGSTGWIMVWRHLHQLRSHTLQESIHFMCVLPIDFDFGKERVLHIDALVLDVGENMLISQRFFLVELVAREGQNLKALVFVLGVELGKTSKIHSCIMI